MIQQQRKRSARYTLRIRKVMTTVFLREVSIMTDHRPPSCNIQIRYHYIITVTPTHPIQDTAIQKTGLKGKRPGSLVARHVP